MLPLDTDVRIDGHRDILRWAMCLKPLGTDFLLFLASPDTRLLDVRRLSRGHRGIQGFPLSDAVNLALASSAAGVIIVQERSAGDEANRSQDFDLTIAVRLVLEESGIELLDHLLLVQDRIISVGGLSVGRGKKTIRAEHPSARHGRRMESRPKPDYGNPAYWQRVRENYEFMTVELGGRRRARRKRVLGAIVAVAGALAAAGLLGLM